MRLKAPSFLPPTAVLEITYRCNHRCLFCSCPWEAAGRGFEKLEEMTSGQWREAIASLCDLGVSSFAFTGGEALLRNDCMELLKHASGLTALKTETIHGELVQRRVPPELYLLSNGSTLDWNILRSLAKLGVRLSISLPGLETFERHTGMDGADQVLRHFRTARELGISTTVNSTVTALNIHELERTLSAAFLAGADQLLMNRFLPGGRGLSHETELLLTAEQVREMLVVADRILVKAGKSGSMGTEIPPCLLEGLDLKRLNVGSRCSAARGFFVVGPSGRVRVCNHSEVRLSHISRWRELKDQEYWKTFTMKRYLPEACSGCRHVLDCDGGCREAAHIKGGSVSSQDPLLASSSAVSPASG